MTLWLLGGVDPTGGAGVTRDALVAAEVAPALDVRTVVCADTQQGDGRPARAVATHPAVLDAALDGIADATAVKVGLVPATVAAIVAAALGRVRCPRVVDPVLWATDGGDMGATIDGARALLAVADLVTPNRREAAALLGCVPSSTQHAIEVTRPWRPAAWLFKDVDPSRAGDVCDWLVDGECVEVLCRPRITGPDPRGTGCALATAIACELACGAPLVDACSRAIMWLDRARRSTAVGIDGRAHLASRRL